MGPSPGSQPSRPVATPANNTAPKNARQTAKGQAEKARGCAEGPDRHTRRDIHTVAEDVVVLGNHVAEVDPDTEADAGSDRLLDLWIANYQDLPALHISAARRTHTSLQDLSDQLVRHRVWFQPPHRPSGSNDLEQVGGVRGCVRRGTVGHVSSPLKDHCAGHNRAATRLVQGDPASRCDG